jgi:hypothetical protein
LVELGATPVMYGYALAAVAPLRADDGEHADALRALRDAFRYAADTANEPLTDVIRSEALPVLAAIGAPEVGATLMPSSLLVGLAAEWQAELDAVRGELGDDGFARARVRAEAMSRPELLEYALGELDRLIAELAESEGAGA